jgi:hypothetical protein
MATEGQVHLELDITFPAAEVGFTVKVQPGNQEDGAAFHIGLRSLQEGKTARFTKECSYALGDFVGGFCRWLGTKGVTVSASEQEITGHFHPRYTVPQTLNTVQEICQMLDDKFAAYPHSILN